MKHRVDRSGRLATGAALAAALLLSGAATIAQTQDERIDGDTQKQLCESLEPTSGEVTPDEITCWGDFARDIHHLFAATPAADATRKAEAGDYRLIRLISSPISLIRLPGVACLLPPPDALVQGDVHLSDIAVPGSGYDLYIGLEARYATAYNHALVDHPSYPYKDLCAPSDDRKVRIERQTWLDATAEVQGDGTLAAATRLGRLEEARALLDDGADPNARDPWDMSPLGWAALRGDAGITRLLLERGANPNSGCAACPTVLARALHGGSAEVLDLLLDAGAEVRASRADSWELGEESLFPEELYESLPWIAVRLGRHDLLARLLEAGADPRATSHRQSPALAALLRDDVESLRLLLASGAGASEHVVDLNSGKIALLQVAAHRDNVAAVRALLEAGAFAEARSDFEEELWRRAVGRGRSDVLLRLVGAGAPLHLLPEAERRQAASAVEQGDVEALGGQIDEAGRRRDELRAAIAAGDVETAGRLMADGTGPMRGHAETELLLAVDRNQPQIVRLLLGHGADPDAIVHPDDLAELRDGFGSGSTPRWNQDSSGRIGPSSPFWFDDPGTAALHALDKAPLEIVEALAARTTPDDSNLTDPRQPYLRAVFGGYGRVVDGRRQGEPRRIEIALALGGSPPFTGPQADQLLERICEATGDDAPLLTKTYLDLGYLPRSANDPPAARSDDYEEGALSTCIWRSPEAALLLLDHGADPDEPGVYGRPPLLYALFPPDNAPPLLGVVERLLEAGADPDTMVHDPGAPLDGLLHRRSEAATDERRAQIDDAIRLLRARGARTREEILGPEPQRPPWKPLLPIE